MLTTAQLTAIKADIAANSDLNSNPDTYDGNQAIADLYALAAVPDYWVWRTYVSKAEFVQATSVDGTTFNWTGAGFITRAQGERDAWRELFTENGFCNPSLASVRQAFADIFSGTGVALANRTHLATVGRKKANRLEKLLKISGTGTTADPAIMGYEGTVTNNEIETARRM